MQAQLREGVSIANQWQLLRPLNEGAMGSVWEARNSRHGGSVAIKFLSNALAADPAMRARFEREARAIAKIRSPHVVQIMDLGVSEDVPYLVMELLEGEDLRRMLEREKALSLSESASIVEQLGRGLSKVHAAGFVHRDVKPDNVFVIHQNDGGQFVKLLDFGIAKHIDAMQPLTQSDHILGTAHYLSPEQIESPPEVDARSDVWSVGVLAYRMLIGAMPFEAEGWPELCARILAGKFLAPSEARSSLPTALDAWFERALARDRAARFATIEEATTQFSRLATTYASGLRARGAARSAPPTAAAKRWALRRPAILIAAVLSVLAALGGSLLARQRAQPTQRVVKTASAPPAQHEAGSPPAPPATLSGALPGPSEPERQTETLQAVRPDPAPKPKRASQSAAQPTAAPKPTPTAPAARTVSAPIQSTPPKDRGF